MKRYSQVASVVALAVGLSACQTVQQLAKDLSGDGKAEQERVAAGIAPASINKAGLHIQFNGVQDATRGWLRYKMTLTNRGNQTVGEILGILVDEAGNEHKAATDPGMLDKLPSIADSTLLIGAGSLAGMALTYAGFPLLGPLLIGGYFLYESYKNGDVISISEDFARTSLTTKAISINDQATGALFFPAVKPAKIKVGFVKGETRHWIVLDVTQNKTATAQPAPAAQQPAPAANERTPPPVHDDMPLQDVQRRLAKLGYNPGAQDGKFGRATSQALRQFQGDVGIPVTGMPDSATIRALSSM